MRVLCRPLLNDELAVLLPAKEVFLNHYQDHPKDAQDLLVVGESKVDPSVDPPVLAAWTMICNQMVNLDEALNK